MAPTNVCPHLLGYRGGTDSADGSPGDGDVRRGDGVDGGDGGDDINGSDGPREALYIGNGDDVSACQSGGARMLPGIQGSTQNGTSDTTATVGKAIASASSKAGTGRDIKVSVSTARGVAGCK